MTSFSDMAFGHSSVVRLTRAMGEQADASGSGELERDRGSLKASTFRNVTLMALNTFNLTTFYSGYCSATSVDYMCSSTNGLYLV
jgi:hypothetical protein